MSVLADTSKNSSIRFGDDWVVDEARRCLSCFDPPCQKACPASIPIPEFIRSLNSGNYKRAAKLVRDANSMAAVCGAVCPQEVFCQSVCTRGNIDQPLKIRELHGFATRNESAKLKDVKLRNIKVAIIGAGPAGLTCAAKLSESNYNVTIFEKSPKAGGIPGSSIPNFRLSDETINRDIDYVKNAGIAFELNHFIDDPQSLLNDYQAVFIATGLQVSKRLEIRGEELPQVLDSLTFLERARSGSMENLTGMSVVVVGGGNVSLDVAATAASLGAVDVHLLYRRGPHEMKVWRSELEEVRNRGVLINYLTAPLQIIGDSTGLEAVKCTRMNLIDNLDSSGRRMVMPIPGSDFMMPADIVISAIGLSSDFMKDITINPDYSTSVPGLFAGGDWARGEGTIVEAVRDGKAAASAIVSYLEGK